MTVASWLRVSSVSTWPVSTLNQYGIGVLLGPRRGALDSTVCR